MLHIEYAQSNGMHMPLLEVDVADKNAQFVAFITGPMFRPSSFVASSPGPPSFSMIHAESIEKLGGPGDQAIGFLHF